MPKPKLKPPLDQLESDIIETMVEGLKQWRPDLHYPESHSDMQGCVRGLLSMFEVKRSPMARKLEYDDTIVLKERADNTGQTLCHFCDKLNYGHYYNNIPVCNRHADALNLVV